MRKNFFGFVNLRVDCCPRKGAADIVVKRKHPFALPFGEPVAPLMRDFMSPRHRSARGFHAEAKSFSEPKMASGNSFHLRSRSPET